MLPAGAAAEILAGNQDLVHSLARGCREIRLVENKVRLGIVLGVVTPVPEKILTEETLVTGCSLEETRRYNLVCINIFQRKRHACALYYIEFLFHTVGILSIDSNFAKCETQSIRVLGSVMTPVTAAAAAVSGLARSVLAPGPWRPSKLRLLVETLYFPAGILSSFMARQAEHPG